MGVSPLAQNEARLHGMLQAEARSLARSHLIPFLRYVNPRFKPAWYHRVFAKYLERAARGEIRRLIITVPPRHGKSEMVSRALPAFMLGQNPDAQIIATSYSAELASRMNRDVQRMMDSPEYAALFPDSSLNQDNVRTVAGKAMRNSDLFEVVGHRGFYRSAGVGGSITGMGANVAIIDDPLKNREEARSEVIRQKVWDWFTSTLSTRLEPPGVIILVLTRWHEDDLAGRLLAHAAANPDAEQWTVVNFPAIKEDDSNPEDPRAIGEALWPERYPIEHLRKVRALNEEDFASLYQQNPRPAGGGLFKEAQLKYCYFDGPESGPIPRAVVCSNGDGGLVTCEQRPIPERFDRMVQSWDLTFKDSATSDFVAGGVFGKKGPDTYLLDIYLERADFLKTIAAIEAMSAKWPQANEILIEKKANGDAAMAVLRQKLPGIIGVEPEGGKVSRANAVVPFFAGGNVFIIHPTLHARVSAGVAQLVGFPNAKHDDFVDMVSQALSRLYMRRRGGLVVVNY